MDSLKILKTCPKIDFPERFLTKKPLARPGARGHSRGSTQIHPPTQAGFLFGAGNGANRFPYLGATGVATVRGHAHGGFWAGVPGGDSQPVISVFWQARVRLLVPVIAVIR